MASLARKTGLFGPKPSTKLEIRPNQDYVLIEGSISETQDSTFSVRGKIVVTSNESVNTKGIFVVLQGYRHLLYVIKRMSISTIADKDRSHYFPRPTRMSEPQRARLHNQGVMFKDVVELQDPTTGGSVKKILPGEQELQYSFELPGDISESIEGFSSNIEYNLKAYVDRSGFGSKIETKRHLRIVRTLGQSARDDIASPLTVRHRCSSWQHSFALLTYL